MVRLIASLELLLFVVVLLTAAEGVSAQQVENAARPEVFHVFADVGLTSQFEAYDAEISSNVLVSDPFGTPTETEQRDTNRLITLLLLRMRAGVMSPPLQALPGSPRIVFSGAALIPSTSSAFIDSSTTFISLTNPLGPPNSELDDVADFELETNQGIGWAASIGASYEPKIVPSDIDLRIVANVEYFGRTISYKGDASRTFEDRPQRFQPSVEIPRPRLPVETDDEIHHFLGFGVSLEGSLAKVGPATLSLFIDGRWLARVNGGSKRGTASDTVTDTIGRTLDANASYNFKPAAHIGQVGAGLRIAF